MIDKTYTVTGTIAGQHAKTGEIIYWEREVYQRNGTSCVVKSYINLNMHVIASFKTRQDAESFERFRMGAITADVTTEDLKQMADNARFINDHNLRRALFFKVL